MSARSDGTDASGVPRNARRTYSPSSKCNPSGSVGGDFKIALTQNLFGLASLISVEPLDQQDAVEMSISC